MIEVKTGLFSDGSAYERSMGRWSQRVGVNFLDWMDVPAGGRWLDVGCGNGAFTEALIKRQKPEGTYGIDPSKAQVDYAAGRQGCAGAQFQTGDAQNLPYEDSAFDAAAMALVISFIPDPDKAAAELARVVRPGGVAGTYMWDTVGDGHPANPINKAMRALGLSGPGAPHAGAGQLDRLREIWTGAGFTSVETTVIRIDVTHPDFDDFWGSNIISTGPLGSRLNALSSRETAALQERLQMDLPHNADGLIAYGAHANAVKGIVPG